MLFFCNVGVSSQAGLHQQDVYYEADYEGPYVVDRVDECPEGSLYSEVCKEWEDECQNPCDDCCYVEAAGVPVSAFSTLEQGSDVSSLMLNDEVVSDEDSCDRSQDSTVSVHPGEVCSAGTVDPPCLQDEERDDDRDDNALLVGDLLRSQVGESICRSYYVSCYASSNCSCDRTDSCDEDHDLVIQVIEYAGRVEHCFAVSHLSSLGEVSTDECACCHWKRHSV